MPVVRIQNTSDWDEVTPTISVQKGDPNWDESYKNWLDGKNPTNSSEWKKGIFGCFTLVEGK